MCDGIGLFPYYKTIFGEEVKTDPKTVVIVGGSGSVWSFPRTELN